MEYCDCGVSYSVYEEHIKTYHKGKDIMHLLPEPIDNRKIVNGQSVTIESAALLEKNAQIDREYLEYLKKPEVIICKTCNPVRAFGCMGEYVHRSHRH